MSDSARRSNWVERSDRGGFLHLTLGRLGESLAKRTQLDDFSRLELRIASCQVLQRGIKPLLLVVGVTADDSALHDLLEQLVTGLLIGRVHHDVATWTKLGFYHFLWVVRRKTELTGASGTA